jgi:hypothetical protein
MGPVEPSAAAKASAICMHWSRIDKEVAGRRMKETLAKVAPPYAPMDRTTAWPRLPVVPQITTLLPALEATEARLAGTPEYECGILFTHHRVDGLTAQNMESFAKHNRDCVTIPLATEQSVFPGSYRLDENDHWTAITMRRGRGVWRNVDLAYWLYYSERKFRCKRWLFSDWDMHCTGPLADFYGDAWDADVACAHPAVIGEDYYWFREIDRLPADFQPFAAGVIPMAGTLVSDKAMRLMTAMSAELSYDLFSELRVGTLARRCGFEIKQLPDPSTIRWQRRPEIVAPGLYHPVKERQTVESGGGQQCH